MDLHHVVVCSLSNKMGTVEFQEA